MWQAWLNFILGAWLFVSGFIPALHTASGKLWDYLIVGILALIFSAWIAKRRWPQWLNLILALWLIIGAFIPWTGTAVAVNSIIVGILMAIFGLWAALMKPETA